MAATCSGALTFGRVTTNPSGSAPNASNNTSSVRTARRRVCSSRLLHRMPTNGGRSADRRTRAANRAAASSSASGRSPSPSSMCDINSCRIATCLE